VKQESLCLWRRGDGRRQDDGEGYTIDAEDAELGNLLERGWS
jgi:hypothetical protein